MNKGAIVWKQHIDNHLICERRRRWIFVLQSGYRKLCLNFIDDDEADKFNLVFYSLFPQLRCLEGKIPFYVSDKGTVIRNETMDKMRTITKSRNSYNNYRNKESSDIKKDDIEKFIKIAKLPKNVLEDPDDANEVYDFYQKNRYELDGMFADKVACSTYSKIYDLDLSSSKRKSKKRPEHIYLHPPLPGSSKFLALPSNFDASPPLNMITGRRNLNQQSKLSQGSSGSCENSFKGSSQTSLSEIPLPNKLYSAPPSEYSSSSGTESDTSSLEYTPQLRNIIDKADQKSINTRITSAPPLPPKVTVLKESPKIPRKSSTLTRKYSYLTNDYTNDVDESESETDSSVR